MIVNTNDYYRPCIEMLESAVRERFMDERHRAIWSVVNDPEEVLDAIRNAPPWSNDNREFAVP